MIRLLENKIAVLPLEASERSTTNMLHIPTDSKRRPNQGIVYAKGSEVKNVRVGDHVMFSAFDGTKLAVEGEGIFVILHEDSIEAIVEGTEHHVLLLNDVYEIIDQVEGRILATARDPLKYADVQEVMEDVRGAFRERFFKDSHVHD